MPSTPVFLDPSGKRRKWMRWLGLALLCSVLAACIAFASTVISVPIPAPLSLDFERASPLPFHAQISHFSHHLAFLLPKRLRGRLAGEQGKPLVVAFYTSAADGGASALRRHVAAIDWVAPTLLAIDPSGRLKVTDDPALRHIVAGSVRHPLIVPVLQNIVDGRFDGPRMARLISDRTRRGRLVADLTAYLERTGDAGVMFDVEDLPASSVPNLRALVAATHTALASRHRVVSITMPLDNPAWSPRRFAGVADKLVLMAYDQHWQGGTAGPIAANAWFARKVASAVAGLPAGKAIIALGNYAYDWHGGQVDSLTVEEAWLAARDSGARPGFDKTSGNTAFSYLENGQRHDVWILDAAASWNQLTMLSKLGLGNVALWRLGSEDPGFWAVEKAWRKHGTPDIAAIRQEANVDVEGQGEILRIAATPHPGLRQVDYDPSSGMIVDETYRNLPTPYVVQRTGARECEVALTFDDGPDPQWTPRILSILERYRVPATFFVVGENAIENRDLLRRMAADGDEIGNHSYTHPNMAQEMPAGIGVELNATQRLIEAATGRSTRLFRAPYFGDAEPTTADELTPALIAQQRGYTVIGLHVDPGDWRRPGTEAIATRTLEQIDASNSDRSGNIVLLHDGGGDRSQTVAALPAIITGLRAAGYRIVPVASLAGLGHEAVMPRVSGADLLAVRADVWMFGLLAALIVGLNWTFFFAIALGIARSVTMAVLALFRKQRRPVQPVQTFMPLVSVIIPAFNEERVIEESVRRVLASEYPRLEVIVADDGSRDATSAIVARAFASDPRVTLLTLVNGGKASAVNRALSRATGEIIVALDADTQFEVQTISRLVRWFADPRIGAVAGNAKVGNRVNLVTRWQAVEYVTAQNLERRALDPLDAVMVVPGAVGAWRRTALDEAGGYPEDTLAEDQDLTIAIQRLGWKVAYDGEAVAWTEAPETFRALARQRFRWSFGTLQCLWKHRRILRSGTPPGLALIGMPQAWLFQIVFAVVSPLIDLALLVSILATGLRVAEHGWDQTQTDLLRMATYWLVFTGIDLMCGWIACRLDVRAARFAPLLMLAQRFVYRQLMYWVVIQAVASALAGLGIGWGKLERTGRVTVQDGAIAPQGLAAA